MITRASSKNGSKVAEMRPYAIDTVRFRTEVSKPSDGTPDIFPPLDRSDVPAAKNYMSTAILTVLLIVYHVRSKNSLPHKSTTAMIINAGQKLGFPEDATIPSLLSETSNLETARIAIIDGPSGQIVYTHSSFRHAVIRLAQHFHHCGGIRPGSVVGLLDTNNVCTFGSSLARSLTS